MGNMCTSLYRCSTYIKMFKEVIAMFKNKINFIKNPKLSETQMRREEGVGRKKPTKSRSLS